MLRSNSSVAGIIAGPSMADGKTHKAIGMTSGAIFAAYKAKNQTPENFIIEAIGGALGGYAGGILPDYLEPAISSWHRDIAHSVAAGSTVVAGAKKMLA